MNYYIDKTIRKRRCRQCGYLIPKDTACISRKRNIPKTFWIDTLSYCSQCSKEILNNNIIKTKQLLIEIQLLTNNTQIEKERVKAINPWNEYFIYNTHGNANIVTAATV